MVMMRDGDGCCCFLFVCGGKMERVMTSESEVDFQRSVRFAVRLTQLAEWIEPSWAGREKEASTKFKSFFVHLFF
jgi:hypothetical protein